MWYTITCLMLFFACLATLNVMLDRDFGEKENPGKILIYLLLALGMGFFMGFGVYNIHVNSDIVSDDKLEPYRWEINENTEGKSDTTFYYKRP